MATSNSDLITAGCASVYSRMWRRDSWAVEGVKRLVIRLGQQAALLVDRHLILPESPVAPGAHCVKPNVELTGSLRWAEFGLCF